MPLTHCHICNAQIPDIQGPVSDHTYIPQSPGCWKLYTDVLAKEYGEWGYPDIHRLTVDCYAAQHPTLQSNAKSAQSVQVHLLGIYLWIENGMSSAQITKVIGDVVSKNKGEFRWIEPPKHLGGITIADVWKAIDLNEHKIIVNQWAHSVWDAWDDTHPPLTKLLLKKI